MLRSFGLTPARFDLMNALSMAPDVTQSELRRRLGVVRSAVCEMLAVLESLGLVRRTRDSEDRRTWVVRLTARGRELLDRAYGDLIDSGDVPVYVDALLSGGMPEIDTSQVRYEYVGHSLGLGAKLGNAVSGPDLYWWDFEDFYAWFADVDEGDPDWGVPFVKVS